MWRMDDTLKHARWIFKGAGIYGLIVLLPLYGLEDLIARYFPPPVNHPEHFYGLVGVAVAWQVAFVVIGTDPVRYRPLMPAAMIEKFSYVGCLLVLFAHGRVAAAALGPGLGDGLLGLAFAYAYVRTGPHAAKALA